MTQSSDIIIVGGGLSGLSVAHFVSRQRPDLSIILLEKGRRPGGAVQSFQDRGIRAEWGPHGFLNNTAESQELLRDTGLLDRVQLAPLGQFSRFLCHRGRLTALPQSPKELLTTPLLTPFAKLRILADLWTKPLAADQTIGAWAARRFGTGVLHLIDAAVTGTFAGDFNRLSIDAVMPGLRAMEQEAGSVLKGMKAKKKIGSGGKGLPAMMNFPGGMEELTETLARGRDLRLETVARCIVREENGWLVETGDGQLRGRALVLALPVNGTLQLLAPLATPPVAAIPEARLVNVVLAYPDRGQIPRGFGYLAPEREGRFTMGMMFSSRMFPGRCPDGQVLLEALVGGRRHPERLELADETIIEEVCRDISPLLGLPARPDYARVLRPAGGIPQLEMGHPKLQGWLGELMAAQPGLFVTGFGWEGIGMNDMIKAAHKTAAAMLGGETATGVAAVKPVYF